MVEAVGKVRGSSPGGQVGNVAPPPAKSESAQAQSQISLQNQLQNLPLTQVKARLAQLVMGKSLSQAQASLILQRITARQEQMGKEAEGTKAGGTFPSGEAVSQAPSSSAAPAEGAGSHVDKTA